MAIASSVQRPKSLNLIQIATFFIYLVSLASSASLRPSHYHEPTTWTGHSPRNPHGQDQLSTWRKFSNRIIQKILGYPDSVKSLASTSSSRVGDGQPTPRLRTRYSEDLVLRFNYSTADEVWALRDACDVLFLDVWQLGESLVDVRLSKDTVSPLLGLLPESLQHAHTPIMQDLDLAQAVYDSYPQTFSASVRPPDEQLSAPTEDTNIFFQNYQPLGVILPWMRLLASLFPSHVRMISVGKTYEDRDIPALRIGVHPTNSENRLPPRKTIIISGGIHAREWVSTSSVNYVAYSLATQYGKIQHVTNLVESFDWIFIPSMNPDGYAYTWNEDRLWRKNRQSTPLRFCSGIDLDRSYGYHWDGAVTSDNPCSESFAGEEPFQAPETHTFVNWVRNETRNNSVEVVGFLDLHSYSQEVLYPYSYSCTASPPSLENLQEVAMGLAKAIRLSDGHYYKVVSACEGNVMSTSSRELHQSTLPQGGGSALDWFYGEMGVHYAFQIKLRDTGSYGFLLPKQHIVPTGKEALAAVLHLGKHLRGDLDFQESEQGTNIISAKFRLPFGSSTPQNSRRKPTSLDGRTSLDQDSNDVDVTRDKPLLDEHEQWELRRRRR